MRSKYFQFIIILFVFAKCTSTSEDAQSIVDKSIQAHGGDLYEKSIIEFDFRGRHYVAQRNNDAYEYQRIFDDSLGVYHDILTNNGFTRLLNEKEVNLTDEWKGKYSSSVNSVVYFALLPFGLNDDAVNKKLLGEEEIKGKTYYKIEVTFDQNGGGEDFDDVFVYWINKDNFRMDYLGYYYHTSGAGIRFREGVNVREQGGIVFSDYINYKGSAGYKDVAGLAELFKENKLEKLSEIRLENVKVSRNKH